jgi:uncharacterized membrane protein YedE/YeeE
MSPDFSPVSALVGGALIGLAAGLLWLGNGRIAGISGIVGGLRTQGTDLGWRIAFIAGLVLAPLACAALWRVAPIRIDASPPLIMLGGLLVGFGTRLGSGCTSGHGVCGLARLSVRSLTATLLFMGAGFATVFVARHIVGG